MSTISNNLQSLGSLNLTANQELLSSSLGRIASSSLASSLFPDATGATDSDSLDSQSAGVQSASADIQNSLSSIQTADGYLGGMTGLLAQMSDLVKLAQSNSTNSADVAKYQQEFSALQDQLRAAIGGSTSEIGGAADSSSPVGSFQGSDLFGPGPDGTASPTNLRQGAMLSLISQDSTGSYGLSVTDPDASADIAGATQQVATGRAALGTSQAQLEISAARLMIEQQNLASVLTPINDPDTAQQSTQFAQANILGQSGDALLAQGNQTPATVLNILQD